MSKTYKTYVFALKTLTNLHAGAGDTYFGAIDKAVQRDPVTQRPTIHSHSLKGALREYFEEASDVSPSAINQIFGSPVKGEAKDAKPGAYRFFSADLVAMPIPVTDLNSNENYILAGTDQDVEHCYERLQDLGCDHWTDVSKFKSALDGVGTLINFDESHSALYQECTEDLPVVTRNCLDNGVSVNFWSEEYVPHQSLFVFAIQVLKNDQNEDEKDFLETLDGLTLQIGANATVGYGFSKITQLN
jgi:CRISPR-associated protein Cmr4